jgi:hypothetical protein
MDLEKLTIADLFSLPAEGPAKLAVGLNGERFKAIQQAASCLPSPIGWSEVRTEMAGRMIDALQTTLLGGLVSAWLKSKAVEEKAKKSQSSPETPFSCTLLEHAVESTLHPYVRILLDEKLVQQVDFDVNMTTQIEGLILNLESGSIVSIQPGRCEWSGSIGIDGVDLIERSLVALDLPGHIVFRHPIPLSTPSEPAAKPSRDQARVNN